MTEDLVSKITPENRHDEVPTNVVKFHPTLVGEGYRFDPDVILEAAKGANFTNLVIVAEYEDGEIYIAGAANAGECIILMERAKRQIIFGDADE